MDEIEARSREGKAAPVSALDLTSAIFAAMSISPLLIVVCSNTLSSASRLLRSAFSMLFCLAIYHKKRRTHMSTIAAAGTSRLCCHQSR